jgi:hypothetical protein
MRSRAECPFLIAGKLITTICVASATGSPASSPRLFNSAPEIVSTFNASPVSSSNADGFDTVLPARTTLK